MIQLIYAHTRTPVEAHIDVLPSAKMYSDKKKLPTENTHFDSIFSFNKIIKLLNYLEIVLKKIISKNVIGFIQFIIILSICLIDYPPSLYIKCIN